MIKEHDIVVLDLEIPGKPLVKGDIGTVIHIFPNAAAYLVEFNTLDGEEVAIIELAPSHVRSVQPNEIRHVRALAA